MWMAVETGFLLDCKEMVFEANLFVEIPEKGMNCWCGWKPIEEDLEWADEEVQQWWVDEEIEAAMILKQLAPRED